MTAADKGSKSEPSYVKWTTIVSAAVAAISLAFNVVLGISTYRLDKANQGLDLQLKRAEARVDLEPRYLVITGLAMFDQQEGVVANQVCRELDDWRERWGTGDAEIVVKEGGVTQSHVSARASTSLTLGAGALRPSGC